MSQESKMKQYEKIKSGKIKDSKIRSGQKTGIPEVVKRMIKILLGSDKKVLWLIVLYTVSAGIYPFFGVFLPKIAIGILESGTAAAESGKLAAEGVGSRIAAAILPAAAGPIPIAEAGKYLALAMLAYALTAGLTGWLMVYLENIIEMRLLRLRLYYLGEQMRKLLTMDYKYMEDASFFEEYDKAMRAGNSNNNGIEGIYRKLYKIPAQVLTIAGSFLLIGYLNGWILLCLILHVAVTMWAAKENYENEYKHKKEDAKAWRRISYFYNTTHDFSYGKDIRIYGLKDRIMKNYDAEIAARKALMTRLKNREYRLSFSALGTLLLTNVTMYAILIYQAYQGMAVSSFTMYVSAITGLMAVMLGLGESISLIGRESQYVADYFKMMDTPLVTEGGDALKPQDTLEIVFDHVSFKYPGSDKYIFKDLNLTIHKGERLAVVGVNGAGKSTLVKLMTGLFAPTEGHIYINGVDINQYQKKELYDMFSAVFQDINILAFTIRENVACASENVDDARVLTALEKVGLGEKIKGFDKGLDQMMLKVIDDQGTDFSGGERQKLSIARGLYKNANMIIMDEPTAALDALAEAEIYEQFSSLVEGKTAVYISHRLASTKFCDKIALFDKDGLQEYGSHEELMAKKGQYFEMFTIQGKYYQEDAVKEYRQHMSEAADCRESIA